MNKRVLYIIGISIGSILGFLYWYYIGCTNGTCPLTAKWYTSSIFGAIFGYLIAGQVIDMKNKKKENEQIQPDNQ
jgi:4-hydroxybenzoate polyprenyltransferase